jgi:hypothetical protein
MKKISALAAALALVGAVGSANAQQTGFNQEQAIAAGIVAVVALGILSSSSSTPGQGSE